MENILWKIGHELKLDHIVRAKGSKLSDQSEKTFHDLESGVWCTPLGHCHENVNDAIKKQLPQMAHTGYWFGFQHYNIKPDIVSIGKDPGNGYPVSTVAFSSKAIKKMEQRDFYHFQPHQNDPLGAAAAGAVIDVIYDQGLVGTSARTGIYFKGKLVQLAEKHRCIKDVRGRGLMIAVEFDKRIDDEHINTLHDQMVSNGFVFAGRPGLNVFRIDPPLNIQDAVLDEFIAMFDHLLTKVPASF